MVLITWELLPLPAVEIKQGQGGWGPAVTPSVPLRVETQCFQQMGSVLPACLALHLGVSDTPSSKNTPLRALDMLPLAGYLLWQEETAWVTQFERDRQGGLDVGPSGARNFSPPADLQTMTVPLRRWKPPCLLLFCL